MRDRASIRPIHEHTHFFIKQAKPGHGEQATQALGYIVVPERVTRKIVRWLERRNVTFQPK